MQRYTLEEARELGEQMAASLGIPRPHIVEGLRCRYDEATNSIHLNWGDMQAFFQVAPHWDWKLILAHEMRHAYQETKGMMKMVSFTSSFWGPRISTVLWCGEEVVTDWTRMDQEKYRQLPWEKDADEWAFAWCKNNLNKESAA